MYGLNHNYTVVKTLPVALITLVKLQVDNFHNDNMMSWISGKLSLQSIVYVRIENKPINYCIVFLIVMFPASFTLSFSC